MLSAPAGSGFRPPPLPSAFPLEVGAEYDLELWALRASDAGEAGDVSALGEEDRLRAERMAAPADRASFVAARLLLRALLSRRLGCRPAEVPFGREPCPCCGGPDGRPVVAGAHRASVHFSLSRSAGMALVGIAPAPIGVDVQVIQAGNFSHELVALLHPAEREEILSSDPDMRPALFTRLWTRKEAYLKGIGAGIAHGLDSEYLGTDRRTDAPRGWTVIDLPAPVGFAAAAAIGTTT